MKNFFRLIGFLLVFVLAFAAVGAGLVYFSVERLRGERHKVPAPAALTLPTDSASIAEGKRIARTRGCYEGCHGKGIEGGLFFEEAGVGRLVAPNLTKSVRRYSDAELVTMLREGVRPDGKTMVAMPSEMIGALSDDDLAKLIAFLRSEPEAPGPAAEVKLGPLAYLGVVMKQYRTARDLVKERQSLMATTTIPESLAQGHYLAMTLCSECHRPDLMGDTGPMKSPSLGMVGGYELHEFARLMREGVPKSGDTLALMAVTSTTRLVHLTDTEVEALYRYLHSLGSAPADAAGAAH